MHETNVLPIPKYAEEFFKFFLSFYPTNYRKHFGQEMLFVFQDICQEELEKNKTLSLRFWIREIIDLTKSIIEQHISEIQDKGMQKYLQQTLHINIYNIISIIFLLPVILMTMIAVISRIAQRDLSHYNRAVYAFFSHTFLYWTPILFTWVILFPLFAAIISFIPLFKLIVNRKISLFSWNFIKRNVIGIAILLFGLGFIVLIRLHDFVPCLFYGLTHFGFERLNHILSVCRNA